MMKTLPGLSDAPSSVSPDEESGFGALQTTHGLLPLAALDVQARIDGLLYQTVLQQTFQNPYDEPVEATYIFPLPDRAAVTQFRLEVAGRVVEGILKERSEARREYAQAIEAGRRAAIAEEERPDVFTLRVGNIMPGEQAVVRLTLNGPLVYSDGEATFRFPLVVAPRYIPGTPLPGPPVGDGVLPDTDAVPDASRITPPVLLPGFPNSVRLSLAVELHAAGLEVSQLRSSLHTVVIEETGDVWKVQLQPSERLNRDFILRFRVAGEQITTALAVQPDATNGREGTFLLTLVPPASLAESSTPRDVVFVLDRSGSMVGWKMVAARRAIGRLVDTLTERDRFLVLAFDDVVETVPAKNSSELMPATDRQRFRAVEALGKIEARGGTEMAQPLKQAVQQLAGGEAGRSRILVLVTDGQVGHEDQILRHLGSQLQDVRIFTLGIDQAVNAGFLRRLAMLGGGACELVESEDRLDEVMERIHRRIGRPVLTGLRLQPAGLEIDRRSLVPARLPDLYAGTPLFILGRCLPAAKGTMQIEATDAAGGSWSQTVAVGEKGSPMLSAVWARGRIRDLEDRYLAGGDRATLDKQIVETSLPFGVLSRFTAYLAVDVTEVVNPDGKVHRVTQPIEPAAGWAMLGTEKQADDTLEVCAMLAPRAMAPLMVQADMVMSRAAAPRTVQADRLLPGEMLKLKRGLHGLPEASEASAASPLPVLDLTAYRRRATELLHEMQAAAARGDDRVRFLGVLAVQLHALLEDLATTGQADGEVQPLREWLDDVQAWVRGGAVPRDAADLWQRAEAVLTAFSQGTGQTTGTRPRREGWWK